MSHPAAPFRLGHRPALDGIRGLAIIAVMLYHAHRPVSAFSGGYLGVDVFFVLSGFLITILLLEEHVRFGRIDLPRFVARRALRLLPALVLVLTFCAILAIAADLNLYAPDADFYTRSTGERVLPRWAAIGATLGSAQNWVQSTAINPGALSHTWSLAIEDQFYLIWPLALLLMLRRGTTHRTLFCVAVLGIVASAGLRLVLWMSGTSLTRLYFGTDTRADGLIVGCALGIIAAAGWLPESRHARRALGAAAVGASVVVAMLIMTAATPGAATFLYAGGFTGVALATALVIAALLVAPNGPAARALGWRPLVGLGRISYGLYLWHNVLLWQTGPIGVILGSTIADAFALGLAVLIARRSYFDVELRFLRLKDRFRPTSTSAEELPGAPAASSA